MLKKSLSLVTASVALFIGFGYGCSSSSDATTTTTEAGPTEDTGTGKTDGGKTEGGSKTDGPVTEDDAGETTCAPGDVSSFAPEWKPPAAIHANKCTNAQAEQAALCVYDQNQDAATCKAFNEATENADCLKCVFTASTGATLGPVIVLPGSLVQLNFNGCVAALTGDVTATGCGAKSQASNQCADAACDQNCPVDSKGNGLDELNACLKEAGTTACKQFTDAEGTCIDDAVKAGAPAEACNAGSSTEEVAVNLAQIFCGPPGGDAGPADAKNDG